MTPRSPVRAAPSRATGFTLAELAIVLTIIALLLGGMLIPLSAQRDIQQMNEAQRQLLEIKEALHGFAVINGRLPCPTTTSDPAAAKYGIEDASCVNVDGYLPWKSLGLPETDPWGARRSAAADPFTGYWRYRVDSAFASAFTLTTEPTSALTVKDASGNAMTQTTPNSPVAILYSTGPDLTANGLNADSDTTTYEAGERSSSIDDLVVWIGRPVLFSRMITAGKLP
ncbi:type II secretion system protein [Propionivibrio limicola]|uniref:type II secretion system protein n=1 Tax=Propionivibrio limicola TaxID=167645 RepID=UPI001478065D|nr:type II secretion system protein [Propionivibrio limicola]